MAIKYMSSSGGRGVEEKGTMVRRWPATGGEEWVPLEVWSRSSMAGALIPFSKNVRKMVLMFIEMTKEQKQG